MAGGLRPCGRKADWALGRHDPLWPRVLACLEDGHWHALASCARGCRVGERSLRRALRDYARRGVPLQWDAARGVRLRARVSPLRTRRGRVQVCFETDSTNSRLLQALRQGLAFPMALAAEQQSAGRGRQARPWLTPLGGGVALSLAWPMACLPGGRLPEALPLRIGVALVRACARLGLRTVRLKWPNDLVVEGCKLGGILIEGHVAGVVIGVGVNHSFPQRWRGRVGQPLTSLTEWLGRRAPSRARVLEVLLDALGEALRAVGEPWHEAFARRDALAGRPVRISAADGEVWEGVAAGVTAEGALRVLTPEGVRLCHAGEVSVRIKP